MHRSGKMERKTNQKLPKKVIAKTGKSFHSQHKLTQGIKINSDLMATEPGLEDLVKKYINDTARIHTCVYRPILA